MLQDPSKYLTCSPGLRESSSPAGSLSQRVLWNPGTAVLKAQVGPVGCQHCLPFYPALSDTLPLHPHCAPRPCLWSPKKIWTRSVSTPAWGPLRLQSHPQPRATIGMGNISGFPLAGQEAAEEVTEESWLITKLWIQNKLLKLSVTTTRFLPSISKERWVRLPSLSPENVSQKQWKSRRPKCRGEVITAMVQAVNSRITIITIIITVCCSSGICGTPGT